MKKILLLLLALSGVAEAAGPQPCYFSGQFVKCFPPGGLWLPSLQTLRLGTDDTTHYVELIAPAGVGTSYTITVPGAVGALGSVLTTTAAGVTSWAYPSSTGYVGTNPEVGGSTPFQLTSSNNRIQDIVPAGAITVKMPTTSVAAGEVWTIINRSSNLVTVQSSGANAIDSLNAGYIQLISTQAAPTTAAHWTTISYKSDYSSAAVTWANTTGTCTGSNGTNSTNKTVRITRTNNAVSVFLGAFTNTPGATDTRIYTVGTTGVPDWAIPNSNDRETSITGEVNSVAEYFRIVVTSAAAGSGCFQLLRLAGNVFGALANTGTVNNVTFTYNLN